MRKIFTVKKSVMSGAILFLLFALVALFYAIESKSYILYSLVLIFGIIGARSLLIYKNGKVILDSKGIEIINLFEKSKMIYWENVAEIKRETFPTPGVFVYSKDKKKHKISLAILSDISPIILYQLTNNKKSTPASPSSPQKQLSEIGQTIVTGIETSFKIPKEKIKMNKPIRSSSTEDTWGFDISSVEFMMQCLEGELGLQMKEEDANLWGEIMSEKSVAELISIFEKIKGQSKLTPEQLNQLMEYEEPIKVSNHPILKEIILGAPVEKIMWLLGGDFQENKNSQFTNRHYQEEGISFSFKANDPLKKLDSFTIDENFKGIIDKNDFLIGDQFYKPYQKFGTPSIVYVDKYGLAQYPQEGLFFYVDKNEEGSVTTKSIIRKIQLKKRFGRIT